MLPAVEVLAVEKPGEPGGHHAFGVSGWRDFCDLDVAERDAVAMAEPGDVARAALHALVIRVAGRQLVEIHAEDGFAVELDGHGRA